MRRSKIGAAARLGTMTRLSRWFSGGVAVFLAALFLGLGAYQTVSAGYRAIAWDHATATVTRCDDIDLRSPTCLGTVRQSGAAKAEIPFASGWLGTPRIGEKLGVVVAPDRSKIDFDGWRLVGDAGLPLAAGLVILGVGVWPWLRSRRSASSATR